MISRFTSSNNIRRRLLHRLLSDDNIKRRSFSSSNSHTFSSYEYPLRTSPPIITKTLSSELSSSSSSSISDDDNSSSSSSSSSPPKTRPNNNFDDNPSTLPPSERDEILTKQKQIIKSTLSPHHKITPSSPFTYHPPPKSTPTTKNKSTPIQPPQILTSTLPNGLRLISLESNSQYATVSTLGLLLDYGSRYETPSNAGTNQLMEVLGFHSTPSHPTSSASDIISEAGGMSYVSSSREQMMYCVDILRERAGDVGMPVLCESVCDPRYTEEEVEFGKGVMGLMWEEMGGEVKRDEGLMMAGYEGSQLGKMHFCPPSQIASLTSQHLHDFRSQHLTPSRMVLSATGISHDELHTLAEKYLSHLPPSPTTDTTTTTHPKIPAIYTGGSHYTHSTVEPNLMRLALAFEIPGGWCSEDLIASCVLQTLLGGGNSFSAGGPGKGMYSRLYREILNRYYWVESAESLTNFHSDTGLFYLSGSCPPDKSNDLLRILSHHFLKIATTLPTDDELERAKNMLKCNVLTQLESRLVVMEDLGRQLLTFGRNESQDEMLEKIDAITGEDLRRVGMEMVKREITMCVVGESGEGVKSREEVKGWFEN